MTSKPGPLELADRAPGRKRDDARVVPRRVEPAHQPEHVLLGAAVRARREDLDDPDALAAGRTLAVDRRDAGVPAAGSAHQTATFVASRRTRIRWIGSSTAPHSYLYGLVAAEEVESADALVEGPADVFRDEQDAGRQVARIGIDAGVVVEIAVGGPEHHAGGDASIADGQERQAERAVGPELLEHPPNKRS